MQGLDLQFGLYVHLVVVVGLHTVDGRLAVLAHHDGRRNVGRLERQHQVQQGEYGAGGMFADVGLNRRLNPDSALEALLVMPAKGPHVRTLAGITRDGDLLTMQLVVVPAVVELLPDPATHLEVQAGGHGDIARIEQAVNIASQQQAIAGLVLTPLAVRADLIRNVPQHACP